MRKLGRVARIHSPTLVSKSVRTAHLLSRRSGRMENGPTILISSHIHWDHRSLRRTEAGTSDSHTGSRFMTGSRISDLRTSTVGSRSVPNSPVYSSIKSDFEGRNDVWNGGLR